MAAARQAPAGESNAVLLPIAAFAPDDLVQIAQVWHAALSTTMSDAPTAESLRCRFSSDLSTCEVAVVRDSERIVAFIVCERAQRWLRQLFVHPTRQGTGLGTHLLAVAMQAMPGGWLRTDATNQRAQRFYANRGLVELRRRPHPLTGALTVEYGWS